MESLSLQTFDPSDLATTAQMWPPHSVPAPARLHSCDLIYLLLETGFLPFGSSWLCPGAWPKFPNCIYPTYLIIGGICVTSCWVRGQCRPLRLRYAWGKNESNSGSCSQSPDTVIQPWYQVRFPIPGAPSSLFLLLHMQPLRSGVPKRCLLLLACGQQSEVRVIVLARTHRNPSNIDLRKKGILWFV